jgi:hypothetical protein
MTGTEPPLYPENWEELAGDFKRRVGECQNCRKSRDEATLEVHHVVPVSRGGSHSEDNLRVLCRQCHEAAHEDEMAPVIEFFTGWKIPDEDFEVFRTYLRESPMRPNGGDGYYIPLGDLKDSLSDDSEDYSEMPSEIVADSS